jgi:hypothetical protein
MRIVTRHRSAEGQGIDIANVGIVILVLMAMLGRYAYQVFHK